LVVLEGLSAEEVNDLYKNINKQLTGLEAMLSNLLQWSKSQMEGERSYLVRVNLQETMTEVVNLLQPTADFKAIQITLEAIEESTVQVDVNQVRAIFRNLLTNAIKFTAQQGLITVKIYREGGNCVVVSIADTGVGMSKKVLERLFQPKTHFSTYGTDNEKGTGLGLLLVKEFADKNMIELSIKSEEGVGTVFILRFMA
jgi:signal transduction histidine kinase